MTIFYDCHIQYIYQIIECDTVFAYDSSLISFRKVVEMNPIQYSLNSQNNNKLE